MTDSVHWSNIPSLADKISKEDVHQKGQGKFAADFVSWAKTAQLMNEHANGWLFALVKTSEDHWVHVAPDGTGFLIGIFIGPNGEVTPEFPYAITDNRNEPIQAAEVSSRKFTDSHRRAFCAAAAWQFNLAYQLWAREEIEEPENSTPRVEIQQTPVNQGKAGKKQTVGQPAAASKGPGSIDKARREKLMKALSAKREKDPDAFSAFVASFRKEFMLHGETPISNLITSTDHEQFCNNFLNEQQGISSVLSRGAA